MTTPRMACVAGAFFLAATLGAQAQNESPDEIVRSTVNEVLTVIKQTKDQKALVELAETKVLPRFDFARMTQLAVGRSWAKASPEQREALQRAFSTLLVRTYTAALSQSSGETRVEVKPVPDGASTDVTVRTMVHEPGRKPFSIDYRMSRASGEWKVWDVLAEGVSLVTNYRSSFQSEISRSGIDGLIKVIEDKNRQLKS